MTHARFYGQMQSSGSTWVLSKLQPHVSIRLKQLFPRLPKSGSGPFELRMNPDIAADLQWFLTRYPLAMTTEDQLLLTDQAQGYFDTQAEAERILLPDWRPKGRLGLKAGQKLRDYQLSFLDYAEMMRSLLLVDDIGLGKTYEGLSIGLLPGALPLAVVVQPHLQRQWHQKAEAFINLRVHSIRGTRPYDLPEADIYLFRYSQISGWVDVLSTGFFKAVAYDEVQELRRGTDSAKGGAAGSMYQAIPIRVGLTATPVYNYGIEAFNIVQLLRTGLLGTREEFLREWCGNDAQGLVKDPDALGAYLREQHFMLRRTKRDVGQSAKQQAPHLEWIEPNTTAVDESAKLAEQLAITTLSGGFQESGMAAREFDLRMREMTGIAKAKQVAAYVRMFAESGTPVLLFGWHREVYRIWLEELADLNPLMYTGSESTAQKERAKADFIAGKSNILIMSLRSGAGADGIQARCSTVVFGELDWSPKIHEQCVGRVDRDGQEAPVYSFYAVTLFGSDPTVIDVHGLKEGQGRGITDPGVKRDKQQTDPERIRRLARDWLAARGILPPERETAAKGDTPTLAEQVALL